ncbi:unnamed protein product [Mytilus edulis]|uniref:SWIM-type domain-containing protein n=1 Tax=Mytilus edulis TaxID=6550 RepID=A0A8S3SCY6_MYTED|nr:unnamed protein product [Mytilus edulis]
MSFKFQNVNDLKGFLQKRGVTCYFYRKDHLVKLCDLALELQLPILNEENDMEPDITISSLTRRTLVIGGKEVIAPEVSSIVWSADLRFIPNIEIGDILVYMLYYCGWSSDKLITRTMVINELFRANHIDSVKISPQFDGNCYYVGGTCIPETRQKESPYDVWILVRPSGEIVSGGCSCVAGNEACKHCIALLFSIESFSERHRDRFIQACTYVVLCILDKPKKKSVPMEIDEIDIGRDTSTKLKRTPMTKNYKPASTIEHCGIEKDMYKLFSGTDSLMLKISTRQVMHLRMKQRLKSLPFLMLYHLAYCLKGNLWQVISKTVYSDLDDIISKIEELTGTITQ